MTLEIPNNQGGSGAAGQKRPGFMERVDQFYAEKNEWKKLNGGCPISSDLKATLELLSTNIHPTVPNLAEMVKASVLNYSADGQTLESIWSDKIAEGANFVGVVDGVFGFYRGEEKLATNNKPLRISAQPAVLELREKERAIVKDSAKLARQTLIAGFKMDGTIVNSSPLVLPNGPALELEKGQL